MVCIFDPASELLPPWMKELYHLCTVAPLLYLLSDLLPNVQTVCDCGGGGCWNVLWAIFWTRFRTYKFSSPPQTKMTSKDDIKGLVSLNFLRPRVPTQGRGWLGGGGDRSTSRKSAACLFMHICICLSTPVSQHQQKAFLGPGHNKAVQKQIIKSRTAFLRIFWVIWKL